MDIACNIIGIKIIFQYCAALLLA